jgi:hypothetical protein
MAVGAVVGGFDSIGRPLCTRPPMPEYSEGLRVRMIPAGGKEIRTLGPAVEERPFRRAPYGFFRGNLQNVRSLPMTIRHTEGLNEFPPELRI